MEQQKVLTIQSEVAKACRHHWMIESPNGQVSKGVCRRCGEVRDFKNYMEISSFGSNPTSSDRESDLLSALHLVGASEDHEEN